MHLLFLLLVDLHFSPLKYIGETDQVSLYFILFMKGHNLCEGTVSFFLFRSKAGI